ncbi:MAG: autotransporter-associated beta strand repeat-containing protein [Tepidisphaeraceae bacterium]
MWLENEREGSWTRAMSMALPVVAWVTLLQLPAPARAIVYRNDESEATAKGLATQQQFSGAGQVFNGAKNEYGTATLILPDWVLTAKHVVTGYTTATFKGISGTVYTDPNSDMALVHLASNASGANTAPGFMGGEAGNLVWLVGLGGHGTVSQSANGGANLTYDGTLHAGTNVVREYSNPFLYFDNGNTSATSSVYEASTAPGDSGGPMFEQVKNVWYVVGATYGASSNGFIHTPTNPQKNFILSTIRSVKGDPSFNFSTPAAPTAMTWDANILTSGVSDGSGVWDIQRTNFYSAATGFNYQWDNTMQNDVTFGNGTGAAGVVTIAATHVSSGPKIDGTTGPTFSADGVTAHSLTFNAAASGHYQITAAGSAGLTLVSSSAGDPVLTANVDAEIAAPITGSTATITKAGLGKLTLSGTNTYAGRTIVAAGALQAASAGALPNSAAAGGVAVRSGATMTVNAGGASEWTAAQINALADAGTFDGGSSLGIDTTTAAFAYGASLSGAMGLAKSGVNTLTDSAANTYVGDTRVIGGTLKFTNTAGLPGASRVTVSAGGTLELDGYVSGGTQTFANPFTLSGSGAAGSRGALVFNNGNIYTVNLAGGVTLAGNTTIGAYGVRETIQFNAPITGAGGLAFNDEGGLKNSHTFTAVFNAQNTYAGNTTLSSGNGNQAIFRLGVDDALPSGTVLTLAPAAGRLTFNLNGHDQTVAGLVLNAASELAMTLGSNSDLLTTGTLSLGSGVAVNVTMANGFGAGSYSLIDYSGLLTNADLLSTWTAAGLSPAYAYQFALGTDSATQLPSVLLNVTSVPEPTVGAMLLGAGLIVTRRRRSRQC